jgi:hypothetical protein
MKPLFRTFVPCLTLHVSTRANPVNGRLLRHLKRSPSSGLSPVYLRQRTKAIELVENESLLQAVFTFNRLPVENINGSQLKVADRQLDAELLIPDSGELTALCFGACTLGPKLEQRVTELFQQRRASLALALDSLGTELLFELGRRLHDRIVIDCRRQGLSVGQDLHAGDPGLELSAQATVLELAEAQKIGINLHDSNLLQPLKSSSVVFAVGKDLPKPNWSRCDHCPSRERCRLTQNSRDAA